MKKVRSNSLVIPILLIFVFACGVPRSSPAITGTPVPSASAVETRATPAHPAEVIFHNGIILTMDDKQPQAQAIAIDGERILAVGANDEIIALKGSSTQVIDLQGKTVMPGFIDSHTHRITQRYKWGFSTPQEAVAEALSQGWTGLDELAIDQNQLQELIDLNAQGGLHSRVNVYLMVDSFEGNPLGDWFRAYKPGQEYSPFLRIAGLKIFIDYDSGRKLLYQQTKLNKLVRQLQTEGWTISMKAIGIQSHELALNAFEYALNGESNAKHRHRIEHSIASSDEQVARMARAGIIVCIQPSLPGEYAFDPDVIKMRSENGANNAYRWRDYQAAGVFLLASPVNPYPDRAELLSDTHIAPMGVLYRGLTQIGLNNQQPEAWMLGKTLTVEQILPMLTINGAYATFAEHEKGSLTPGKYADIVILSGNPLVTSAEGLSSIQNLLTMVGSKTEYCAAGQESLCPGQQGASGVPSPTPETHLAAPFSGTWQGIDPDDGSVLTITLLQTPAGMTGTYKDSYSRKIPPPGFEGSGTATELSTTTAKITFNLTRWDGKTAQAPYSLALSNQNNTLTLGCAAGCPVVLQRQP